MDSGDGAGLEVEYVGSSGPTGPRRCAAPGLGSRSRRDAAPSAAPRPGDPRLTTPHECQHDETGDDRTGQVGQPGQQHAEGDDDADGHESGAQHARKRSAGANAKSTGSLRGSWSPDSVTDRLHPRSGPPTKSTLVGRGEEGSHSDSHCARNDSWRWFENGFLSKPRSTNSGRSSSADSTAPDWRWNVRRRLSEREGRPVRPPGPTSGCLAGGPGTIVQPAATSAPRARHRVGEWRARQARHRVHRGRAAPAGHRPRAPHPAPARPGLRLGGPSSWAAPSSSRAEQRPASWQRGRDSNPRLTSLPATAFKAVPIGHSGTPPGPSRDRPRV